MDVLRAQRGIASESTRRQQRRAGPDDSRLARCVVDLERRPLFRARTGAAAPSTPPALRRARAPGARRPRDSSPYRSRCRGRSPAPSPARPPRHRASGPSPEPRRIRSTTRAESSGSASGLTSRITSTVGAVQMNPAYIAEPPIAGPFSTRITLAPSLAARAAALIPAIPPPKTRRSTIASRIRHHNTSSRLPELN